jgi:hypothetical protein
MRYPNTFSIARLATQSLPSGRPQEIPRLLRSGTEGAHGGDFGLPLLDGSLAVLDRNIPRAC